MLNFTQYMPTEILFGRGMEQHTGALVSKWGAKRVLLVYGGGSVVKSGLLEKIKGQLEMEHIAYEELSGVQPNPRLRLVREGVEQAIAFEADMILAVGGGSVIDTAKAVAVGVKAPETDLWSFWEGQQVVKDALSVGVVLTISAAGSETSDSAVLTNEETGKKCGITSDWIRPKFAIMNPELTFTLQKYQIACGIVDIFMHTIERYFTRESGNRMTDEIAEGLLRTVVTYGKQAYEKPTDYEAMSEIMWCGSISHNGMTGLGRSKDFTNHKLGHEISGMFDEAHGATLSAVWGSWARYVYQLDIPRFAHYGKQVWGIEKKEEEEAALAAIEQTEAFFCSIEMPVRIGNMRIGVQPDAVLHKLAENATKKDTIKLGCFKPLTAHDAYEIYKSANN